MTTLGVFAQIIAWIDTAARVADVKSALDYDLRDLAPDARTCDSRLWWANFKAHKRLRLMTDV